MISNNGNGNNNNNTSPSSSISSSTSSTATAATTSSATVYDNPQEQQQQQQLPSSFVLDGLLYTLPGAMIGSDGTYHFKVLVPSVAAGAIIGKGGETIAQMQKETGARVKMSKSHDFYPGTTERVCLITGNVPSIIAVLEFIMDKIREKPDMSKPPLAEGDGKQLQERDKQVKILVPNSTAGMVIGKAGNYIKTIKEASGSYVQISQKPKDASLQERCITVIGDKEPNKQACLMILNKVVDDPQSGTCTNVSYADVSGPVANYNPTGSPFATSGGIGSVGVAGGMPGSGQNAISPFNASNASLNNAVSQSLMLNGGLNLSLNLSAPSQNLQITAQLVDTIKMQLRNCGYSESSLSEIITSLSILAKHGILAVGLGLGHHHSGAGAQGLPAGAASYIFADHHHHHPTSAQQAAAAQVAAAAVAAAANATNGPYGQLTGLSVGDCMAAAGGASTASPRNVLDRYDAYDPFRHQNSANAATAPISINNNSFGLGTGQPGAMTLLSKSPTPAELNGGKDSKNVEIAEVIVGAILGPGGRSLVEIQQLSGANIQISKKGIFAPGTRNRIVTITGNMGAINTAQYLIEQRIAEEEVKRARTNALGTLAIQ